MDFLLISTAGALVAIILMFVVGNAVYNRTKDSVVSLVASWAVAAVFAVCLMQFAKWHMRQATERFLSRIEARQHCQGEPPQRCVHDQTESYHHRVHYRHHRSNPINPHLFHHHLRWRR